jgi:Mg2+-importing ATPase
MEITRFTTLSTLALSSELSTSEKGLTSSEAKSRLKKYGENVLSAHQVTWYEVLLRQFTSPFVYVLVAAALLSLILGEAFDGIMILAFIGINTILGFIQEYQSARTLELLKRYVVSQAKVRREDTEMLIDAKLLVPGDVIKIEIGDIVPADLRLISSNGLAVDESLLSGEAASVPKLSDALSIEASGISDSTNIVFSSSKIVSGSGIGIVVATGVKTIVGDIAKLTVETKREGLFEKGIAGFSSFILKMIVGILILIFALNLIIKGSGANVADLILFSIALAVSVIPEGLPVVTTLSLSRGALQLAKNKVVVKRLAAVEDLGSIEVLCTDKTGTITENRMAVSGIYGPEQNMLFEAGLLSASYIAEGEAEPNNSFDLALWHKVSKAAQESIRKVPRLADIPFDPARRRNSALVTHKGKSVLFVRGAPEAIANASTLTNEEKQALINWSAEEGKAGKRTIALARKELPKATTYTVNDESKLQFLGALSFVDPIKSTTVKAITDAKALGITVKIITGDGPEVAAAVAHQVGLISDPTHVITGDALEALPPPEQGAAVLSHSVFARVSPRQKYRIIELLKMSRRVGFLGEGINDAPALKTANVALVVAEASDIARDAADIVLLNPSLQVIVDAIRDGRGILENTTKYLKITLISNFGNFFSVALASLISDTLPMLPLQLLLLNLLTDFPMIAISMDNVDIEDVRRPETHDLHGVIFISVALGIISTIFDFVFFGLYRNDPTGVLQTNWFIGSVLTELFLIYSLRTKRICFNGSPISFTLALLTIPAALVAVILPFTSFGVRVFKFVTPTPMYIAQIVFVALAYFVTTEIGKRYYYRFYAWWQKHHESRTSQISRTT